MATPEEPREQANERVLLVFPPFGALAFPSIGLGLLKSALSAAGIGCDIRYLNFDFLDLMPGDFSARLATCDEIQRRNDFCVGDWIFTGALYDEQTARTLDERFRAYTREHGVDEDLVERCFAVKAMVPAFLDAVMSSIPWDQYAVVGFHSLFNQTTASLAIARRVKERYPDIVTLFGGPNAADEMGVELLRRFPQLDYVIQGEADRTIVPIVSRLMAGEPIHDIAGVTRRVGGRALDGGPVVHANPVDIVQDMSALPVPDYDDYFERFRGRGYEDAIDVFLPMENARGCWWGAKHHCTFCGLDANTMKFRFKKPDRVMAEVHSQVERYGVRSISCVDSILEMSYCRELMPRLRASGLGLRIFCWVKANLTHEQVDVLADAGVVLLQPGLEHLSSEVLALMHKGTTFLQNVQFLKWSHERDITVFWSILFGFPGEEYAWYEQVAAQIPALVHLYPPKGAVRVRVDRFSPLFTMPEQLGLGRIVVSGGYRHVYPFPDDAVHRLGYQFEGEYIRRDPTLNERIEGLIGPLVAGWNQRFFQGSAALDMLASPTRLLVHDRRGPAPARYFLIEGLARDVYLACDAAASRAFIESATREGRGAPVDVLALLQISPEDAAIDVVLRSASERGAPVERIAPVGDELDTILERFLSERLVVSEGDRYLALAVPVHEIRSLLAVAKPASDGQRNMAATRKVSLDL